MHDCIIETKDGRQIGWISVGQRVDPLTGRTIYQHGPIRQTYQQALECAATPNTLGYVNHVEPCSTRHERPTAAIRKLDYSYGEFLNRWQALEAAFGQQVAA